MLIEFVLTLLLATASVFAARFVGVGSRLLQLPVGLILLIAIRLVTYSLLALVQLTQFANLIFYVALLAICGFGIWHWRKQLRLTDFALAAAVSVISVAQVWVLGVFPPKHGDSLYILAMAEKLSTGAGPAGFNNSNAIKRGFAYPAMLSISEPGTYYAAFTFFNFACLLLLAFWLVKALTKTLNQRQVTLVFAGLTVAAFTSAMGLRLMVYINGHLMFGLAILAAVSVILLSRQRGSLDRAGLFILLACQIVLTTSRPEGVAFAVLVALPILEQRILKPLLVATLIALPMLSFTIWLVIFDSYLLESIPLGAVTLLALGVIGGVITSLPFVGRLLKHSTTMAIATFGLLLLAVTALAPEQMASGFAAQAVNLFGLGGDWGFTFWILLAVIAISAGTIKQVSELALMLKLGLLFALASFSSKLADAGQSGTISIGRVAWQDSLNRMWIHFVMLFLVIAVVAFATRLQKGKTVSKLEL